MMNNYNDVRSTANTNSNYELAASEPRNVLENRRICNEINDLYERKNAVDLANYAIMTVQELDNMEDK